MYLSCVPHEHPPISFSLIPITIIPYSNVYAIHQWVHVLHHSACVAKDYNIVEFCPSVCRSLRHGQTKLWGWGGGGGSSPSTLCWAPSFFKCVYYVSVCLTIKKLLPQGLRSTPWKSKISWGCMPLDPLSLDGYWFKAEPSHFAEHSQLLSETYTVWHKLNCTVTCVSVHGWNSKPTIPRGWVQRDMQSPPPTSIKADIAPPPPQSGKKLIHQSCNLLIATT